MRRIFVATVGLLLSGCVLVPNVQSGAPARPIPKPQAFQTDFSVVIGNVEPTAERMCRSQTDGGSCDFQIVVDNRPGQPANAFQSIDGKGRPVLTFTTALIGQAHNDDELAFVLGHEAAHHILGHLTQKRDVALVGAVLGGLFAGLAGGGAQAVDTAQNLGGLVGSRVYSKDFELEADALGARISMQTGYDALKGARFFTRIADPGDQFLGSHPPNRDRINVVRNVVSGVK